MTKVNLTFTVQINEIFLKNEKVFITGSLPELGNWLPTMAIVLKRQERSLVNQNEIWSVEILLPLSNLEYRYFIGNINENEAYTEKSISVITWESHIYPRKMNVLSRVYRPSDRVSLDIYGEIDNHTHILRGWLTDLTAAQIRLFGDSVKLYKSSLKSKPIFIKCHFFQMNKYRDDIDDDENCDPLDYQVAKVSKLTDSGFQPQLPPPEGTEYCQDHLTFHVETIDLEDMGIEIEIRQRKRDSVHNIRLTSSDGSASDQKDVNRLSLTEENPEFVLLGIARLSLMPSKRAVKSISIYNKHNRAIGEIKVDFLAVYPLMGHRYTMESTYQMHWKHRKTLKVGHKGSGTSYGHLTKMSTVRENTLYSLKNAFSHGADFVEFDVQLSKDKIPVLYHDFKVCTVLRKKKRDDLQFMEIPVKDIDLKDLQALKVDHTSAMTDCKSVEIMFMDDADPTELQPFPTLQACLEEVDISLGFNIELKYPQLLMNGDNEQRNYFNRNVFVDSILHVVAKFAGRRRLIFSSFDPDVCIMLSLKQNKHPTIFLTQGNSTEYEAYSDPRTHSIENALYFSKSYNILGLSALASNMAENIDIVQRILNFKIILFLWGESNNDLEAQKKWISLGIHGIILDRIEEIHEHGTRNVFVIGSALPNALNATSSEYL